MTIVPSSELMIRIRRSSTPTEIKLQDIVHANYLASKTPPQGKVCIPWAQFSMRIIETLVPSIFTFPQNIVSLSMTSPISPHRSLTPKSLRSSLLWCFITIGNQCRDHEERKEKHLLKLLLVRQLSIRPNATLLIEVPGYVHQYSYGDYGPRVPQYLLWTPVVTFQYLSSYNSPNQIYTHNWCTVKIYNLCYLKFSSSFLKERIIWIIYTKEIDEWYGDAF